MTGTLHFTIMRAPDNHDLDLDHNINKVVTGYLPFTIPLLDTLSVMIMMIVVIMVMGMKVMRMMVTLMIKSEMTLDSFPNPCDAPEVGWHSINVDCNTITASCQLLK